MHVGTLIAGRFEIICYGGTGGMASVYQAKDRETGLPVAIKLLHGPGSAESGRFAREARVLSELDHPGIVNFIAHGVTPSGELFIAMEWLEGEDLRTFLNREGQISVADTLAIGLQIADALGSAHAQGIIHRDIKPSNLWLEHRQLDALKIIDFGVARLQSNTQTATGLGMTVGTPGYMAPEQARGELEVNARADVFSLGCVLFECLTGQAPFMGEHVMAVLAKVLLQDAPSVHEFRFDVPKALEDAIARMLCKNASDRFTDGLAVYQALLAIEHNAEAAAVALRSTVPPPGALTRSEQRLISVVIGATDAALGPAHTGEIKYSSLPLHAPEYDSASLPSVLPPKLADGMLGSAWDNASLQQLRQTVRAYGARLEILSETSIIAMVEDTGAPAEQVIQTARCAQAMLAVAPQARLAIATGKGIVNELFPMGGVIDQAFDTLNGGEPGKIAIDEATAQRVSTRFEVLHNDHAATKWLGKEHEIAFTHKTVLGKTLPCVGRSRELSLLATTFRTCVDEPSARAVLITAPSGIGKSRIREEFMQSLWHERAPVEIIFGAGNPMSASSPFATLAPALRRLCGVIDGEPLDVQQYKTRLRIARSVDESNVARITDFLGEFMDVPFPDAYSVTLSAARQNPLLMADQMRQAWLDWLDAESKKQPVLIVLEDLHWVDKGTIQYVEVALRTLQERPIMVLGLGQPELHQRFANVWNECDVTELRLRGLSHQASLQFIKAALGGREIASEHIENLIEQAQGNAFYLEELVRHEVQGIEDHVPDTILGMVQTRLELLDVDARRVLRAASVFGRRFSKESAMALLGGEQSRAHTERHLDALVKHELIMEQSAMLAPHSGQYLFRHDLVREAVYAMLTEEDRVLGHRLAAQWLEKNGENNAYLIAQHFEHGGQLKDAVDHYRHAVRDAYAANDLDSLLICVEAALRCQPEDEVQGELCLMAAEAYHWKNNFELAEHFGRAALEKLPADSPYILQTLGELCALAGMQGEHQNLIRWAAQLQNQDHSGPDRIRAFMVALTRAAWQLFSTGYYHQAENLMAKAEDHWPKLQAQSQQPTPWVVARLHRMRSLQLQSKGFISDALDELILCKREFERAGDLRNEALESVAVGSLHIAMGHHRKAQTVLREALSLAEKAKLDYVTAHAQSQLGLALSREGHLEEALALEHKAIEALSLHKGKRLEGNARVYLADVLMQLGLLDDAVEQAAIAAEVLSPFAPRQAYALASLAQILLASGNIDGALTHARQGIQIFEDLGRVIEGESRIRLAYAEALYAHGDKLLARETLQQAYKNLLARADKLKDGETRQLFLRAIPENYRTLTLLAQWVPDLRQQPQLLTS